MDLHNLAVQQPRPAATVVMLRDGAAGLEVFMLKRHGLSDVLGGAYVFPGGKVDQEDAADELVQRLDRSAAQLHATLNEPELNAAQAAGLYVAAIREAFEEAGVLFARDIDAQQAAQAALLLREGRAFDEMLGLLGLQLRASLLVPWCRWITPLRASVVQKRFDARFFVAAMPAGQEALHDDHETTDSMWQAPRAVLYDYWEGRVELAPPQIMSLAHLSRHQGVDSVLEQARQHPPPVIHPESFEVDGERLVCYPGDERHPVAQRALPGPTRLRYRNRRFEPVDGFESLFA